ncbi:hypothetical protein N0V93_000079 [Gnomoniopsis smithogilvyi]|uniref:Uncharacterized protein n=1 Tax=Gnomoniopsis smithogilvyi TaxID=1191159 RepID=A0A9W8Z184_9PEZI|nr:hypothetical protein N0V93_000079 [Gnomoniopsis smithogilvyi]
MGAVYGNALLTIVAAEGDSRYGPTGMEGVSRPRGLSQRIIPFGNEKLLVRNTNMFDLSGTFLDTRDGHHSRAWTFLDSWHEEMILGAEIATYVDLRQDLVMSGFPDLGSLSRIITKFNATELRYDEDVLPAVSGLLLVLSRSFTGGFSYEIPEMYFERGLGWTAYWKPGDLRRRKVSNRPVESRLTQSELPSWSWMGWQGLLDPFGDREASRINDAQNEIEESFPITQWYTSKSSGGPPERRIRPTWFASRDTYKTWQSLCLKAGLATKPLSRTNFLTALVYTRTAAATTFSSI